MIELDTEILVIGSGFGGGVAASRLVEQGKEVLMLERGPWRRTLPSASMNIRNSAALARESWWYTFRYTLASVSDHRWTGARGLGINRRNGMFEVNKHACYASMCTSQVGGGSLVWAAAIARPYREDYWDNRAEGVSEAVLAPHFERVTRELGTSIMGEAPEVPDHWARNWAANDEIDFSASYSIGVAHRLPGREENADPAWGIDRAESEFRGHMSLGCLDGSKASTDSIYVGPALAGGMTLLASCEAEQISRDADGGYAVRAHRLDTGERILIHCQKLVLGAGTYNTVRLLLEAQAREDLAPMPGLGLGISGNGDEPALLWNVKQPGQGEPRRGLFSIFHLRGGRRDLQHGFIEMDLPLTHWPLLRGLARVFNNTLLLVSMGVDASDGVARLAKKRLKFDFEPAKSAANQDGKRENRQIARLLGLRVIFLPVRFTLHMSGGARVGSSPEEGVVNGAGEAWNNPGLYVVDAAAIPEAPGTPPSLNIAAWASHVAAGITVEAPGLGTDATPQLPDGTALESCSAGTLSLLFACLPKPQADKNLRGQPGLGSWHAKPLRSVVPSWRRLFKRLRAYDIRVIACQPALATLKPELSLKHRFELANAWDGSGLAWQWSGAEGEDESGKKIELQARPLVSQPGYLASVYRDQRHEGWYILNQLQPAGK